MTNTNQNKTKVKNKNPKEEGRKEIKMKKNQKPVRSATTNPSQKPPNLKKKNKKQIIKYKN